MYKTITRCDFHDAFRRMDRKDNFSYEGLNALFDYFEELEQETGPIEIDVIAICCEYRESTFDEIREDYRNKFEPNASNKEILEELQNETTIIWHDSERVIYQEF